MKNLIKLEELAFFALSVWALTHFHAAWWFYPLLLMGPDISMLGYLGGNRTGAFIYNVFHHKAVATLLFTTGIIFNETTLQLAGITLFGHSSMDRAFGYGLKLKEGFKHTHLGLIGKESYTGRS